MSSQSPEGANGETKKPKDTPFSQQKLPAWQPVLTAGTVLPAFFVIGIAFVAIGVGLLYFTNGIKEKELDYTECKNLDNLEEECAKTIQDAWKPENLSNWKPCKCEVPFKLDEDWEGPVYLYYGLTNFYQNHRRYVKSRDEKQLLGNIEKTGTNSDCAPYYREEGEKVTVPCGAIANSMFNDVITLKDGAGTEVPLIRTGIAWESDRKYKFGNPDTNGTSLKDFLESKTLRPKDWIKDLWELDTEDEENNGLLNEDLIVWMRTAAFPNFRKLYRKINHTVEEFKTGLPAGKYTFDIEYSYRVKSFSGTKSIVLSQISILGGKNSFLPISYIIVGILCLLIGVAFLFIHVKYGKLFQSSIELTKGQQHLEKIHDLSNLSEPLRIIEK